MKNFYLGVDIGTDSVGIACTDEQYNLLRAKGKDLWAVRLFDPANDATERRAKRTARRRLQRRKQRIALLQGVFAPYMEDNLFFIRLNNSAFYVEDKNKDLKSRFSLFDDENFNDVNFYDKKTGYPTIFHLRQALIERRFTEKPDLRLYYLAIHHIIKYRGHFLFEGESVGDIRNAKKLFENYNAVVSELFEDLDLSLPVDKADEFRNLALSQKTLNDKKKEAISLLGGVSPERKEIISFIIGATASPAKLFGEEYAEKYKEEKTFSFRDINDETFEGKREIYEDDHYALLESLRAIYNFTIFEKVLGGYNNVSDSMVAIYEKHAADLKDLKDLLKLSNNQDIYYKIFRSKKETANYANYVGYSKSNGKKFKLKTCKYDDFLKFLKKTLAPVENGELKEKILKEIEEKTFLPKILHADNGLFPHQINGMELDAILKNLCEDYPEFAQKDTDGYVVCEKIRKIFTFKIPYYVGPLNVAHENGGQGNSWMVRKEEGKITPWNFTEKVDLAESNEKFIRRMTNKCSYLHGQDVLPKGSLYYQAFDVLNQINKITLNEIPLTVELKQEIFNNVFLRNKKVTQKQIKDYLVTSGKCTASESKSINIGSFNADIKANMSSYVILKSRLGDFVDEHPEICEDIILLHTLNTDKKIVEDMILNRYGSHKIIKENIKWIKGLTAFKEFGRLSKKLICEISGGADDVTGEVYTVLNQLYNTNYNFNQLINLDKYTFAQSIENENTGKDSNVTYEDVASLYVSPMVRRGIWQSIQMVDEYVSLLGKAPDKIFIEVTRNNETEKEKQKNKNRRESRKNQILSLYKDVGADCRDIDELMKELNKETVTDSSLRQERLYLYFLQLGRCAYTGERIDLGELSTDLYDVDHIMPRSITKDDSLDNKVLVKRVKNAEKTDVYPLPVGFTSQQGFWKVLKSKNLMSDKKYALLTRTKLLGEEDFREFVNRQLVVTNQTVKAVAELLKRKYGESGTRIVYSKSKNVDEFKQRYNIIKCRETNDLHHARDAYLNVVVGNVYDTKFTCAYDYFYRKENDAWREYNLQRMFDREVKGAWNGLDDLSRVKQTVQKTSMQVTRYAYTNNGEFYNATIYPKTDEGISIPIKNVYPYTKTEKYGGFKSLTTAYFAIVESKDKKGNCIKTIEAIPVLVEYQKRTNPSCVMDYLKKDVGLNEPKILVPKLKVKSLVSINGFKAWIAGVTGDRLIVHNAQQWFTDSQTDLYVKNLLKLADMEKTGRLSDNEIGNETFSMIKNRKDEKLTVDKAQNLELYNKIIEKLQANCYQGLSGARNFTEKLQQKRELFENLTTLNQVKVLLQIIRFMKCNAECADLSLVEDGKVCGKLLINKNIADVDFAIIHQSPCGTVTRVQKI